MKDTTGSRIEHDSMGDSRMLDIIYNPLQSIEMETVTARLLAEKCVQEITADVRKCRKYAEAGAALITALAPVIGCEHAARLFKRALREEKSIRQIICEEQLLSTEQLDVILNLPALAAGRRQRMK